MPIGKNAIKRVSNNGYSKVKTTAPDMENSVSVEEILEAPIDVEVVFNAEEKLEIQKAESRVKASNKAPAKSKSSEPKKEAAPKKVARTGPKKEAAPKKSLEKEPDLSPVKTAEKVIEKPAEKNERQGDGYVNLGGKMPIHLL
jgi:hypothetical protein